MRKLFTNTWSKVVAMSAALFFSVTVNAQVATSYTFSQSAGTYTPISGGTVVATATVGGTGVTALDDVNYSGIPIPFTFTFNNVPYTSLCINTNGYVTFGATLPTNTTNAPISSANGYSGAIAAICRDLQGNVIAGNLGEIRYEALGSTPTQTFVIQYSNWRRFSGTDDFDFQIRLEEGTNVISVVHGPHVPITTSNTVQLGLRGATNTDFNNRTSTTSWAATTPGGANNSTVTYSSTVFPANGQTYVWTPVAACAGTPTAGTIGGLNTLCSGTGTTLSLTGQTVAPGITYQWQSSTTSGGPYTNMGTATTQATGNLSATTYYVVVVTCTNGGATATTTEFTVTVNPPPVVTVTPNTPVVCTGGSVALTASGSSVSYAWAPALGLSATTGTNVTANPQGTLTYTITGTDAGGCTGTTTVTVTIAEAPSISAVTATPASVCANGSSQLNGAAGTTSGYTVASQAFAAEACQANAGPTGDDAVQGGNAIGFTFQYFGVAYTNFGISTNGNIQLGNGSGDAFNPAYSNQWADAVNPTAAVPNNLIALAWDDWLISAGQITWGTTGAAPNRKLVVCFNTTGRGTGAADTLNGQIVLEETTNKIYLNITKKGVSTNTCTQGIENRNGTAGVPVAGRQVQAWSANNNTMVFTPNGGTLTYLWSPATFLSSTTVSNPMATNITATTTYTVDVTNNGCISTGTVTITAGSPLTSSGSIAPAATVCDGVTVTLNSTATGGGAPYTYAWSGPNSFASTLQNPTVVASAAAAGTYTLVITDACAATSTVTLTLAVNALPSVVVTPTSALFCSGGPAISLTASGSSVSYSWGPAAGLSATTGTNVDASPSASTTYTVTGTDGNGCVNSATTAITYAPGITNAAIAATPTAVCIGSSVNLNATSDGIPGTILTEDFNSGAPSWTRANTSTGGNPALAAWTDRTSPYVYAAVPYSSNDASGFVMTNSDAQGSGSTTRTQLISPAFSTLGYNAINLSFYHYYRDIGDNGDSAVIEASLDNITWTRITQYTATAGAASGFVPANVVLPPAYDNQATVYVRFRFIATWDWYWCVDNVSITGNTSAGFTFAWTASPSGFTSSIQNPTDNPTTTTTYSVVMTTPAGCSASASLPVTVNALPVVTASAAPSTVCEGDMVTATGSGASTYVWTGGIMDNVPFAAMSTATYTVTGTDANGCTNTATASVTVNALPAVTASLTPSTVCAGDMVTPAGNGASTYVWTGGLTDGVAFAAMMSDTYTVTGTDANGCSNTATASVTVNALPTVTASLTPSTVCAGDMVTPAGSGASTYVWTGGLTDGVAFAAMMSDTYTVTGTDANGCTNTATASVTVNTLPTVTASLTPSTACAGDMVTPAGSGAATYVWSGGLTDGVAFAAMTSDTYTVTGTDANGCSDTTSVSITVNPLPTVTASATDSTVCVGDQITFMGGGALAYTWDNGVTDMVPYTVSGSMTFIVTGTDANGCMDTASLAITANALPNVTVSLPLDTACLLLGPVTLGGESPAGGIWSGAGVTGNTFDPGVAGNGTHAITYTYMDSVTGCTASAIDSILVDICNGIDNSTVGTAVVYPNPNNGDFTLIPAGSGLVDVMIYNATGQLVVAEKAMAGQPRQIRLEASGMYSVVIITASGTRTTQRVVVNR